MVSMNPNGIEVKTNRGTVSTPTYDAPKRRDKRQKPELRLQRFENPCWLARSSIRDGAARDANRNVRRERFGLGKLDDETIVTGSQSFQQRQGNRLGKKVHTPIAVEGLDPSGVC